MSVLLLAMMPPFVAIMIPLFKMLSALGAWSTAGRRWLCRRSRRPSLIMLFQPGVEAPSHNDIIEAAPVWTA